MKNYLQTHLHIAAHLSMLALALILGAGYAQYTSKNIEKHVEEAITEVQSTLYELAVITDRNGADSITEKIISDCSRRNEYESLLIKLGTLSQKDLITMQGLYESCGSFYKERKALMVSKLERELKSLNDLIELQKTINEKKAGSHNLAVWKDMVMLEKERSSLLTDQTEIQKNIITALVSGSSVQSNDVTDFVARAQEINDLLAVDDQRIDELRKNIKN